MKTIFVVLAAVLLFLRAWATPESLLAASAKLKGVFYDSGDAGRSELEADDGLSLWRQVEMQSMDVRMIGARCQRALYFKQRNNLNEVERERKRIAEDLQKLRQRITKLHPITLKHWTHVPHESVVTAYQDLVSEVERFEIDFRNGKFLWAEGK